MSLSISTKRLSTHTILILSTVISGVYTTECEVLKLAFESTNVHTYKQRAQRSVRGTAPAAAATEWTLGEGKDMHVVTEAVGVEVALEGCPGLNFGDQCLDHGLKVNTTGLVQAM